MTEYTPSGRRIKPFDFALQRVRMPREVAERLASYLPPDLAKRFMADAGYGPPLEPVTLECDFAERELRGAALDPTLITYQKYLQRTPDHD